MTNDFSAPGKENENLWSIELLDEMTGRIRITSWQQAVDVSGKWQLEIDGKRHSFGQFRIDRISAGESRDFLLSIEVPDLVYSSEAVLIVNLLNRDGFTLVRTGFPVPPPAYLVPEPPAEQYFTGVRFDVSQAIISSGKLSAVIDANGMRELRYNGRKLLSGGPRLSLWRHNMVPDNLKPLKLDRLRVSADRFVSDGKSIECHALALPTLMEMDELEFTQRFTPQDNGTIRCDLEFVVPGSFAGIPRLGVVMRLPGTMDQVTFFGNGPEENYPGDTGFIRSSYTLPVKDFYHPDENFSSGGSRSEVKNLIISDADGNQLKIIAGNRFSFAALPFSEAALSDAVRNDLPPVNESEVSLYIDCRIGNKQPVDAGLYRLTIFFAV